MAPEVQAVEQVEEKISLIANDLRKRTANAVSKSISRHKRKQQKKGRRREQPSGEAPSAGMEVSPSPAQERLRERPADDIRTRPAEDSRPAPMRERQPEITHGRPAVSDLGSKHTPAGLFSNKRMRQTAIKEKRNRCTDIRQKSAGSLGRQADTPVQKPAAVQSKPQERMRQKAKVELQARCTMVGRVPIPSCTEGQPAPRPVTESTSVFADYQSIHSIKERPRHSFASKEKFPGGAFIPKTRQNIAAVSRPSAKTASTMTRKNAAVPPFKLAKRRVQQNAQRKLLQQSTMKTKTALDLFRKTAVVTAKAAVSLTSAITGFLGGAVLLSIFCLIIFVAAIAASPFGILFTNEPMPGAIPLNAAVGQLNMELSSRLEALQSGSYSSIDIQGQGPDWREVIAVFAAKTAGADDGIDVAALTPDRVDRLKAVFWDMCAVTSKIETISHPDSNPDDDTNDSWTERILHITITAKTAEDMRTEYAFSDFQNQALTDLLAELSRMDKLLNDLSVSGEQARNVLQNLPANLSPERRAAVETACQLVGKVNYFWGGKSYAIGWDSRWGTIQKVWAAGNSTTGTYRPFGLDCSGFIDWTLRNAGLPSDGHWYINRNLTAVSLEDALPGDLALYPDASHVGMVVGWNEAGKLLVCHCSSGRNNVVITEFAVSGFTVAGRLAFMGG